MTTKVIFKAGNPSEIIIPDGKFANSSGELINRKGQRLTGLEDKRLVSSRGKDVSIQDFSHFGMAILRESVTSRTRVAFINAPVNGKRVSWIPHVESVTYLGKEK